MPILPTTIQNALIRLPAAAQSIAGVLVGLAFAASVAWLALELGPVAVLALFGVFAGGLWVVRGQIGLISDDWPATVPVPPAPPKVQVSIEEENDQPATPKPFLDLVPLAGGTFLMGSDRSSDPNSREDEQPRHEVRLDPFRIARTPVTRGQ